MTTMRFASHGRIAVALAGVVALTANALGQSVDTAAQTTDVATANSSFSAKANFWPTPVVNSIKCEQRLNSAELKPYLSWTAPAGSAPAGGWKYQVVMHRIVGTTFNGETYTYVSNHAGLDIYLTDTSATRGKDWYARVYTINGPKTSMGYRGAGLWHNGASIGNVGNCTGNYEFEDNLAGFNAAPPVLESVTARQALDAEAASEGQGPEPDLPLAGVDSTTSSRPSPSVELPTPAKPSQAETTTRPSTSMRTLSSSTSPRATQAVTSQVTSTLTPPVTGTTTTSTTVPTTASSVPLPGGGEAEIVGGTTLVVSDAAGDVCTVKVRPGSTLKLRSGVLEVTDGVETRVVDQETCELT